VRLRSVFALFFCFSLTAHFAASAAASTPANCGPGYSLLGRSYAAGAAEALPISIEDAKAFTLLAWAKTARFMRINGIADIPENQTKILNVFDSALSQQLTPLGLGRKFRRENGLRVVDAPQLEGLRDRNVPEYILKHITIDHHNSFGIGLRGDVNSTTQILDMLDAKNPAYIPPAEFTRAFKNFSSDNVGDAFGLGRSVVRNAEKIRANPKLRKELERLAIEEDFGVFGPGLNLDDSDKLPALLNLNDRLLRSIGPERTFMDRIDLQFSQGTADAIKSSSDDYDRILFPKSVEDRELTKKLADEFRTAVREGIQKAEKARVVISGASGRPAPIYFADTTALAKEQGGEFESWVTIPQFVRKLEKGGAAPLERNFKISGDANGSTRTVICTNFPGRGFSMTTALPGQSQSFSEALVQAERAAIEARLPSLRARGVEAVGLAEERLASIRRGTWAHQSRPDGSIIFGTTYMTAEEFRKFVEKNTPLLGYD
jgi:hypothetical protein